MIKLLVIDDQTLIREGISSMLGLEEDLEIAATGCNGEEAVRLYREHKPDLVLMDIRMPLMDGIEAVRQIRRADPGAKILMLTTFDEQDYVSRSLQEGAMGYLLKDTPIEDLSQAVRLAARGIHQLGPGITEKLMEADSSKSESPGYSEEEKKEFLLYYNNMTARERDVLKLLSRGETNADIAGNLGLSGGTVKNYVSNILAAFDLKDRTQAALLARTFRDLL